MRWQRSELEEIGVSALQVLAGRSYYAEVKRLQAGPLGTRSWEAIRKQLRACVAEFRHLGVRRGS